MSFFILPFEIISLISFFCIYLKHVVDLLCCLISYFIFYYHWGNSFNILTWCKLLINNASPLSFSSDVLNVFSFCANAELWTNGSNGMGTGAGTCESAKWLCVVSCLLFLLRDIPELSAQTHMQSSEACMSHALPWRQDVSLSKRTSCKVRQIYGLNNDLRFWQVSLIFIPSVCVQTWRTCC